MELQVLGPLAVVRAGQVVDHGGPKQAALLEALALHLRHVVRTGALADLDAAAYARALPYAGRTVVAGSGGPLGPVDAFLALAAVAAGERETARRHADDAERLCRTWQVPRVTQWLREVRHRHGI